MFFAKRRKIPDAAYATPLGQQPGQGRTGAKAARTVLEGRIYGRPRFMKRAANRSRVSLGPFAVALVIGVRPGEDFRDAKLGLAQAALALCFAALQFFIPLLHRVTLPDRCTPIRLFQQLLGNGDPADVGKELFIEIDLIF